MRRHEPYEFSELATHNGEVARGIVHTPEWKARMAADKALFDARFYAEADRKGWVIVNDPRLARPQDANPVTVEGHTMTDTTDRTSGKRTSAKNTEGAPETMTVAEYRAATQAWVDGTCHYRNLAIRLGAKPEDMLSKYDRDLAEKGIDTSGEGWDDDDTPELWEEIAAAEQVIAEADDLLRRLAGWDHLPLLGDGPFWLGEIAKTRAAIAALSEAASRGMSTPDSSRVSAENRRAPDGDFNRTSRRT